MTPRRRALAALALLAAAAVLAPGARAQQVIADLSRHLVAITTGFAGAEVLLFGAVDGEGDVIVTVRGPEGDVVVRRKSQVNGMWINTQSVTFGAVPGYYAVASTKPIEEIVTPPVAEREQIGAGRLRLEPERNIPPETVAQFRLALLRNMERNGLFQARAAPIRFLGQRLFRADIVFPANVPTGLYTVNVYLVKGGQVVSAATTPLSVSKIGLSAEIFDFAQNRGFSYGVIAVAFAGFAGWAASRLFQRG
ncbi:MAG: TIGR02186 family protein [Candidatus Odyssella sp.]|nr:TIGR02186 family protein [Candidatus Odyssella sp.]